MLIDSDVVNKFYNKRVCCVAQTIILIVSQLEVSLPTEKPQNIIRM